MTLAEQRLITEFNSNMRWLKQNLKAIPSQPEWGTYEDAAKILPKSKSWYQKRRLNKELVKGADWRAVGKSIEYNLLSIERLKTELINASVA